MTQQSETNTPATMAISNTKHHDNTGTTKSNPAALQGGTEITTAASDMSKTERRRLARKRKKDRLFHEKQEVIVRKNNSNNNKKAKRITKDERREKYTQRARDRRETKRLQGSEQNMVCFLCRKKGHSARHCPENPNGTSSSSEPTTNGNSIVPICYRCGSTEHRLQGCPKLKSKQITNKTSLPYATCFVCGQEGHLASQCSSNPNGVYVSGMGACRICGKKDHLAKHCPLQKQPDKEETSPMPMPITSHLVSESGAVGDEDPGLLLEEERRRKNISTKQQRPKVVQF